MIEAILKILEEDQRYSIEAYSFVSRALKYAQHEMVVASEEETAEEDEEHQRHLTGQQLCEAIRTYALDQFGYISQVVLKSWGITSTSDFGEIVYNMIRAEEMRKSPSDRREHFDDVYDFDEAFVKGFRFPPITD